jgi:hypothetical protein
VRDECGRQLAPARRSAGVGLPAFPCAATKELRSRPRRARQDAGPALRLALVYRVRHTEALRVLADAGWIWRGVAPSPSRPLFLIEEKNLLLSRV